MRRIRMVRLAVCVVFLVSCIVFGAYLLKVRLVEDHKPPRISMKEDSITVSVEAGDKELLQGVTAEDNRDGDITDSIRISSMSHFIQKGKRTISYIVFDQANQPASAQRTLIYKDYRSPRIYLKKPLRYTSSEARNTDLLQNMTADDCLDGDLSGQIRMTLTDSWYDLDPGDYNFSVQVSNSAGDVCSLPLTLSITGGDSTGEAGKCYPMLSDYIVYTSVGKKLELKDYLVGVIRGNRESLFEDGETEVSAAAIGVSSEVNYDIPGIYEVSYSYTSPAGVGAVTKLYVVVEE